MAASEGRIQCLHREGKGGLGSAYIAGFQWALANTDTKYVFEMDADFSHDPAAIPEFLEEIGDADLVVGNEHEGMAFGEKWGFGKTQGSFEREAACLCVQGAHQPMARRSS